MPRRISIVTVMFDTLFFIRLLVGKVREFIGARDYEIIVVDRARRDKLGAAGRAMALRHPFERQTDEFLQHYEEIITARVPKRYV